ncbi:MAG: hypothetical protein OHK0024_15010 [Thalassobaculales bacterium]
MTMLLSPGTFAALNAPPPAPAGQLFDMLAEMVDQLSQVLEAELAALAERRMKVFQGLQADKARLAADYHKLQQALRKDPSSLRDAPPERRDQFARKMQAFQALLERNMRRIKAAMSAGERVFGAMKEAMQKKRDETAVYTATGALGRPKAYGAQPAISVAINRKF